MQIEVGQAVIQHNGVSSVEAEVGHAVVHHEDANSESMNAAIIGVGFTINTSEFSWSDKAVWKESAHNTKWCLLGCSMGDMGTIAFFQFVYTDSGWTTMSIMLLAILNGLLTSIALETIILSKKMILIEAFKTACGMSLISMISMEAAMNIVDYLMTGGAMLSIYTILPMLIAGFLTPWPYNYWRLKKYNKACC